MSIVVNEDKSKLIDVKCIISNDNKAIGNLYLGNYLTAQCLEWLKDQQITHVIALLSSKNDELIKKYEEMGVTFEFYRSFDIWDQDLTQYFEDSHKSLSDKLSKGNVQVHCAAGRSRSATIVISYIMSQNKQTLEKAHEYVLSKKNNIDPNDGFLKQLKDYEISIFSENC